jgi:hypothetical protein
MMASELFAYRMKEFSVIEAIERAMDARETERQS